jgi:predicted nucleic acid-binding protein
VGKYKRPCLDSSVFIGGLNGEICNGVKRRVVLDYILEQARVGEFTVFISAITIAEVYKTRKRAKSGEKQLDEMLELINEPFVEVIEVDREVGIKAHKLCRKYALRKLYPNDAIHLACALRAKCDVLLAWDTPLIGVAHPDIRIEEPMIHDRTLFSENEKATTEEIQAYEATRMQKSSIADSPEVSGSGGEYTEGQAGAENGAKA